MTQPYEICALCGKSLHSADTKNIGDVFVHRDCGLPIQHLLRVVNDHIVTGVIGLVRDGYTTKEACIKAGVRHLDVKGLSELETLL